MKRLLFLTFMILSLAGCFDLSAARQQQGDREQWMTEMRQYKRAYFSKELDLPRDKQEAFFSLYEEMEAKVAKIDDDTRALERRVADLKDPSDLEYQKATEAIYDAQVKTSAIEREYMDKFAKVLTPKQLFMLKGVERKFAREIMKQHHRLRSKMKGEKADRPEKADK